jgi:phosphate transport system substrate-binding protein
MSGPSTPPGAGGSPPPSLPPRPVVRRRSGRSTWFAGLGAVVVVAVLVGAGLATHWFGLVPASSARPCPTGTTLQGAGASFPSALISQWVASYSTATANLVNYAASGAGEGITLLIDKQVDFAVTDEPLNGTETTDLTGAVGTSLTLPVTGGAVALIYNLPGYSGPLNLTPTDVAGIFNGSITAWDDPALVANNAGLAGSSATIFAVHRIDPAGMSYVLTNLLSDDNAAWRTGPGTSIQPDWPSFTGAVGESGNSGLVKEVQRQDGAIGYTDLYDAEINRLPTVLVQNAHGGFVAPTVASTTSAVDDVYNASPGSFPASNASWEDVSFVNAPGPDDYPLATLAYILVPQDPAQGRTASASDAEVLVQWLHWTLTSGESFDSAAFPFVNPPGPLVTEALAALSSMNYNKAPIPTCP